MPKPNGGTRNEGLFVFASAHKDATTQEWHLARPRFDLDTAPDHGEAGTFHSLQDFAVKLFTGAVVPPDADVGA